MDFTGFIFTVLPHPVGCMSTPSPNVTLENDDPLWRAPSPKDNILLTHHIALTPAVVSVPFELRRWLHFCKRIFI
jgi:hypothetical protein